MCVYCAVILLCWDLLYRYMVSITKGHIMSAQCTRCLCDMFECAVNPKAWFKTPSYVHGNSETQSIETFTFCQTYCAIALELNRLPKPHHPTPASQTQNSTEMRIPFRIEFHPIRTNKMQFCGFKTTIWIERRSILSIEPSIASWIIHNEPYFRKSTICTLKVFIPLKNCN